MIRLATKKTGKNWIEMGDGIKFLIAYPSTTQEQLLQDILMSSDELKINSIVKYQRQFIKYTVKDWTGLNVDCKLIKDELENELWWNLVSDLGQVLDIYTKISGELEFNNSDKKKLESVDTSGIKD